ncbi:uncharacterized protein LODBEIA_P02750 [Lodderomyces beijingensis]|uniref:non-specific serine/threonine protein kinase n=1 Tax=Lodderomyces beijingensis TaxID=1775926 RepID=A0ABP0ZFW1_9ASCO
MEEFEQYEKGGLLRNRYSKVSDISEGSYGLVSVARDTKRNNLLVAVKYIYPVDYKKKKEKKDGAGGEGEEQGQNKNHSNRPCSSPARLKSPPQSIVNNLDFDNDREEDASSIFDSLKDEAQKEIRIHEILGNHPNISGLYDHFDSCLILELCTRGDLYEAIHKGNGPASTPDIKDVFNQILNAIEFCHSKGVYHRDLKPENILIAEDWSIKICDWGLATTTRIVTDRDEFDIGSERYMAPELFDKEIESYDASKIDIWSLGVILLTLVFHKNPFQVANYSDKRFLQFVSNREALFDFFSTMSGDLFSVLRFSLTIDPDNRSLRNLGDELNALRFFTIDEEYEASDYEYDEEEEEDVEDDYGSFDEESKVQASPPSLPPASGLKEAKITEEDDDFAVARLVEEIPHNHRADALLSTSAKSKPIPINSLKFKFIRNTRKPLNVASYNQNPNVNGRYSNSFGNKSNFHREDFFTPRSVFNHYMDKYGEKRHLGRYSVNGNGFSGSANGFTNGISTGNGNSNGNGGVSEFAKRPPPFRRKRTWKQNFRKKYKSQHNGVSNGNSVQIHRTNDYAGNDSHNHQSVNRKRNRSYSTSKLRKNIAGNGIGHASGSMVSSSLALPHPHASAAATTTATNTANANAAGSSLSSSGKYIPPYLRSPQPQPHKSPAVGPLTEEIDNLSLRADYDEVFHLEDDFDVTFDQELGGDDEDNEDEDDDVEEEEEEEVIGSSSGEFDSRLKPKKDATLFSMSGLSNTTSHEKSSSTSPTQTSAKETDHSDSAGKYIPPFKRGSNHHNNNNNNNNNNNQQQNQIQTRKQYTPFANTKTPTIAEVTRILNPTVSRKQNGTGANTNTTSTTTTTAGGLTADLFESKRALAESVSKGLEKWMTGFAKSNNHSAPAMVAAVGGASASSEVIRNGSSDWFATPRKNWSDIDD